MNIHSNTHTANVFRPDGVITLADVRDRASASLKSTARRDTISAFRRLEKQLGIDLYTIPATASRVREIFAELDTGNVGLSPKRLANIRSLVVRAVERFGMARRVVTKAVLFSPAWSALLATATPKLYRCGLNRLAAFCSATGIAPNEVSSDMLLAFHKALVAESFVKHPRKIIKHSIALWNYCQRNIPGWPQIILSSPFAVTPDTLPLDAFPASFRADVERWKDRVSLVDPLDPDAPRRPLRASTIKTYTMHFRRFGSALVRRNVLPVEEITSLSVFFNGENFTEALRHLLRGRNRGTNYIYLTARQLLYVGRHYVGLPEPELKRLAALVARLAPDEPRAMGKRNLNRLEQFDEPDAIRALLTFPVREKERAMACKSPIRGAKAMERALAVSLVIRTGVRIQNLRSIHLDKNIRRTSKVVLLTFSHEEVKNEIDLTHELHDDTLELLDLFLANYRHLLPGHEGRYLFPGMDGSSRSDNAMRDAISRSVKKHTGITLSPHLIRHVVARTVVERNPEMHVPVSRFLGHKNINTTLGFYLGSETRAVGRYINKLLDEAQENPDPED